MRPGTGKRYTAARLITAMHTARHHDGSTLVLLVTPRNSTISCAPRRLAFTSCETRSSFTTFIATLITVSDPGLRKHDGNYLYSSRVSRASMRGTRPRMLIEKRSSV